MIQDEPKVRAHLALLSESEKIDLIIDLMGQVERLTETVATVTSRIAKLEARLGMNSSNSSKPPSSDGYAKPTPKSLRKKSGRKPGGQKGHQGTTLRQVPNPDEIVHHTPGRCDCGHDLSEAPVHGVERRQVIELPEKLTRVIEHRICSKTCPQCGRMNRAIAPPHAPGPVQYGPRMLGLAVYLRHVQFLPYERLTEIFGKILGVGVCKRTVERAQMRAYEALALFAQTVRTHLLEARAVHVDETGMRVESGRHWMHVISTPRLTLYQAHPERGGKAIDEQGILPGFAGVLIHDCFSSYFCYGSRHALCGAHLLRELRGVCENEKHRWAEEMFSLLELMSQTSAASVGAVSSPEVAEWFEQTYNEILLRGIPELPPPLKTPGTRGRAKNAPSANLHHRLGKYRDAVLRFLRDPDVPFTNNQAERDIRMVKLRQKISGCERTPMGAHIFARIRSYISTSRKQGQDLFQNIVNALIGDPWLPQPLASSA